jgi:hypothetical protein
MENYFGDMFDNDGGGKADKKSVLHGVDVDKGNMLIVGSNDSATQYHQIMESQPGWVGTCLAAASWLAQLQPS